MTTKIRSSEDLEIWLKQQPHQVSALVASRIALRVLPLVCLSSPRYIEDLMQAAIRASLLSSIASKYPTDTNKTAAGSAAAAARQAIAAATATATAEVARSAASASGSAARSASAATAAGDVYIAAGAAVFATAQAFSLIETGKLSRDMVAFVGVGKRKVWLEISADINEFLNIGIYSLLNNPVFHTKVDCDLAIAILQEIYRKIGYRAEFWQEAVKSVYIGSVLFGLTEVGERQLLGQIVAQPEQFWKNGKKASNKLDEMYREALEKARGTNEPVPAPEIPPQQPASIRPEWVNNRLVNIAKLGPPDGNRKSLDAAIASLNDDLRELQRHLSSNAEPLFREKLNEHLKIFPQKWPKDLGLMFKMASFQVFLEEYGETVKAEWPGALSALFLTIRFQYERVTASSKEWREFRDKCGPAIKTGDDIENAVVFVSTVLDELKSNKLTGIVDHKLIEELAEAFAAVRKSDQAANSPEAAPSEADRLLAANAQEGANNVMKRLAEPLVSERSRSVANTVDVQTPSQEDRIARTAPLDEEKKSAIGAALQDVKKKLLESYGGEAGKVLAGKSIQWIIDVIAALSKGP